MRRTKKPDSPVQFPDRICVRLDADVRVMLNASAQDVAWANQAHAFNAGLRKSFSKWAPEGLEIQTSPFEQLALSNRITVKRKPSSRPKTKNTRNT